MRSTLTLLLLLLATPALASDGVLEINQTCAVETGCIDHSRGIGDTEGFPVTIEIPGSYVLTGDLVVTDPNKDGIFIATSPIAVDLNGFEIRGPLDCTGFGSTVTCDPGTGRGIRAEGHPRITVVNGSVIKFGSDGVLVAGRSRIEGVVSERNGGNGIDAGDDSVISGARANRNAGRGIEVGNAAVVSNSTSSQNGSSGVSTGSGATVSSTTARANGGPGINVSSGSTVRGCSVHANTGLGISTFSPFSGAVIEDNAVNENGSSGILAGEGSTIRGNSVTANLGTGILAAGALVQGNAIEGNGGLGIGFPAGFLIPSAYRGNFIKNNTDGAVFFVHENLGDNYCFGPNVTSSTCP